MTRRLLFALTAALWLSGAFNALADGHVFRLETVRRDRVFGPFLHADGNIVRIEDRAYRLVVNRNGTMSFLSDVTGDSYGPYDFVAGRIVEIATYLYTLTDIRAATASELAEIRRRSAPPPPAPAPVKPSQPRPLAPPMRPAVETTCVPPAHAELPPPGEIYKELGVEITAMNSVLYDVEFGDAYSRSGTTLERNQLALWFNRDPFLFNFALQWGGEWDDGGDSPSVQFDDVQLSDGGGWSMAAGLRHVFRMDRSWHAVLFTEVSYLRESYSLSYDSWLAATVVTPGTNGAPDTFETVMSRREIVQDVTFSELDLVAGARVAWEGITWSCYGGVRVTPVAMVAISGDIEASSTDYDMVLTLTHPITVEGGAGMMYSGFKFYLDGRAGAEQRLAIGVARRF